MSPKDGATRVGESAEIQESQISVLAGGILAIAFGLLALTLTLNTGWLFPSLLAVAFMAAARFFPAARSARMIRIILVVLAALALASAFIAVLR